MKNFDFFSLDYIYYPVSGIMWVWHKLFANILPGENNPWAWVLSVVFLVFTLRSLLFKPFMGQMNSQMKMQAVAPELKKLKEKYKDDKTRYAEEVQRVNKENGVNVLGGCLPALIQAPVFIGLFHVLRSFKPGQGENYFFGKADVASFVQSKLFGGAPLSAYMTMPLHTKGAQIGLAELDGVRSTVIAVGIPLTILAGIATFLTSRRSVARQQQMQTNTEVAPQAALMNKLMKYVFPLFVVVGGPFFPLAILFYWLSNNTWTFGQLSVAHRLQDKKIAAESMVVDEAREAAKYSTPMPGARPGTRPAPGAKPQIRPAGPRPTTTGSKTSVKPGVGSKPTAGGRPPVSGKPAVGAKPPATKRPVIQPTPKSGPPANNGRTNGSAGLNGDGGSSNGGSSNGGAPNGGAPSLHKAEKGGGSSQYRADDPPPGTIADSSGGKPRQPPAGKKKPGRG